MRLTDTPYGEGSPRLSPDGRYMAYVSDMSGRFEVYVTSFPSGQGRWQVSVDGGDLPRCNRKGDELFFVDLSNRLMSVRVRVSPSFVADTPVVVFDGGRVSPPVQLGNSYDVSSDGRRFVAVQQVGAAEQARAEGVLVEDWRK